MISGSDTENELFKNSIKYLYKISDLGFTPPGLKCLYLTKARLMELRRSTFYLTNAKGICECCLLPFRDGPPSYRIKAKEKKSKFAKALLKKVSQGKSLTKFQLEYVKKLQRKRDGNELVTVCKYCKKETSVNLGLPPKTEENSEQVTRTKKRKRVKKKDKFCGLNENIVLSLTPNSNSFEVSEPALPCKNKKKFKLSKTSKVKEIVKEKIVKKIDKREAKSKIKKKSKLKEFLNSSKSNTPSPSNNLQQFLQGL